MWKHGSGLVGAGVFIGFYLPFVKDTLCVIRGLPAMASMHFIYFGILSNFRDRWFILGVDLKVYSHTHDILYSRPKRFVQCKV